MRGLSVSIADLRQHINWKSTGAAALLAAVLIVPAALQPARAAPAIAGEVLPQPVQVAPFQLQNAAGGAVFDATGLQHRWTLLLFGYTSCPGICPANLTQLSQMTRKLQRSEPQAPLPQLVFVSVDPKRDTLAQLRAYAAAIDPRIVAATGTQAQLRAFEQSFNTSHSYGAAGSGGFYPVNHSAFVYLIDPRGRWVATLRPPFHLDALTGDYVATVEYAARQG